MIEKVVDMKPGAVFELDPLVEPRREGKHGDLQLVGKRVQPIRPMLWVVRTSVVVMHPNFGAFYRCFDLEGYDNWLIPGSEEHEVIGRVIVEKA